MQTALITGKWDTCRDEARKRKRLPSTGFFLCQLAPAGIDLVMMLLQIK